MRGSQFAASSHLLETLARLSYSRGDAVDKADFLPSSSSSAASRILIFNCTCGRSGLSLLGTLLAALSSTSSAQPSQPFAHVIFCTNTTYSSGASKGGKPFFLSLLTMPLRREPEKTHKPQSMYLSGPY